MSHAKKHSARLLLLAPLLLVFIPACRQTANQSDAPIDVREPETYRATIYYSYLPGGNRGVKPNALFSLDVTRRRQDRRYVFHFGDDELSYVEGVDRNYLIAPSCRQYVEATLEELNFRLPSSMAPEEIIAQLRETRGWRRTGTGQVDGRTAIKYVDPASPSPEKALLVDEATGLPLRAELVSRVAGPDGAAVGGRAGDVYLLVELRDVKIKADEKDFQAPAGFEEVRPPRLCPQVNQLAQSAMELLWTISVKKDR
jgi:hypothetical protein